MVFFWLTVGSCDNTRSGRLNLYESAFEAYLKQEFEPAIRYLDQVQALGEDPPSRKLKERCEEYLLSPPGADWDGAYTMKTK